MSSDRRAKKLHLVILSLVAALSWQARAGVNVWTTSGPPATAGSLRVVADPSSELVAYAGTNFGGIFKTTDNGASWLPKNSGLGSSGWIGAIAIDSFNPTTLYLGTSGFSPLFKSTDGGESWKSLAGGGLPVLQSNLNVGALGVSPAAPNNVICSFVDNLGNGSLFRSTDSGQSWTSASSGLPTPGVAASVTFHPTDHNVVVVGMIRPTGQSPGAYRSTDGGASWASANSGLPGGYSTKVLGFAPSDGRLCFASADGPDIALSGLYRSSNAGVTWARLPMTGMPGYNNQPVSLAIDPNDSTKLYGATPVGAFRSSDGGATWSAINSGLPGGPVSSIAIDRSGRHLHAALYSSVYDMDISLTTVDIRVWINGLDPCGPGAACTPGSFVAHVGDTLKAYTYLNGSIDTSPPGGLTWNLGPDATPATGSGQGVTFSYSSSAVGRPQTITAYGYGAPILATGTITNAATSLSVGVQAIPNPAAIGQTIRFSATATGGTPPYSYSWTFSDGTSSSGQNPSKAFSSQGAASALCTARDAAGGTALASLDLTISGDPGAGARLRLLGGVVAGQSVSATSRIVSVSPGQLVNGTLTASIDSIWPAGVVMAMGITPSWGPHSSSYLDLGSFQTPVSGLTRSAAFSFVAPTLPGTYNIIWALRADLTAANVLSATNYSVGASVWDNGDDIAGWSAQTISDANASGTVLANYLFPGAQNVPVYVPATAIHIIVSGPQPCVSGSNRLCLLGSRFKVEVSWRNPYDGGSTGTGIAIPFSANTGLFWFFDSGNLELMVKVLDGRSVNGRFWVFYGSLSDVEYAMTVTDTVSGVVKAYHNFAGTLASVGDIQAF